MAAFVRRRLLDWERDAIASAVLAGEKPAALAAEFDVSDRYPALLAQRRGLVRPRGRPTKKGTRIVSRISL